MSHQCPAKCYNLNSPCSVHMYFRLNTFDLSAALLLRPSHTCQSLFIDLTEPQHQSISEEALSHWIPLRYF
jgi:hypothetical protein